MYKARIYNLSFVLKLLKHRTTKYQNDTDEGIENQIVAIKNKNTNTCTATLCLCQHI